MNSSPVISCDVRLSVVTWDTDREREREAFSRAIKVFYLTKRVISYLNTPRKTTN